MNASEDPMSASSMRKLWQIPSVEPSIGAGAGFGSTGHKEIALINATGEPVGSSTDLWG